MEKTEADLHLKILSWSRVPTVTLDETIRRAKATVGSGHPNSSGWPCGEKAHPLKRGKAGSTGSDCAVRGPGILCVQHRVTKQVEQLLAEIRQSEGEAGFRAGAENEELYQEM